MDFTSVSMFQATLLPIKSEKLNDMDALLGKRKLQRLTKKVEKVNRLITPEEIEKTVKHLSIKKDAMAQDLQKSSV